MEAVAAVATRSARHVERGVGQPWTWEASTIDGTDADEHEDAMKGHGEQKHRRWGALKYLRSWLISLYSGVLLVCHTVYHHRGR